MKKFLDFISKIEVIIAIIVIVVIFVVWLILRKVQSNKYKKVLAELEVRYNQINSIPLAFKLNKAVAIARVDNVLLQNVALCKDDFDFATSNLKQISQTLADLEDALLIGKHKFVKNGLLDLESSIKLGEEQVGKLNAFLDEILEKETQQRAEVTELKDRFREIKNEANEKSHTLSYSWSTIEKNITNIENMFSSFEEWMYASDFEKSSLELINIKSSIAILEEIVKELPDLLQEATGVIPHMIDKVNENSARLTEKNVYLSHLNIDENVRVIMNSLRTDLDSLKKGDATNVKDHIEDYKSRLSLMLESLSNEEKSFDELSMLANNSGKLILEATTNSKYVKKQFEKSSVRFGLEGLDEEIKENDIKLEELDIKQKQVFEQIAKNELPATSVIAALKELYFDIEACNNSFISMRQKIDSAKSDEDRAKKQLLKLQLIMNEMQVKLRKHRLPSISSSYESDLIQGYEYINNIDNLIKETPLAVELLNVTLKDGIDFIYKLYNNVNNIVGMAIMVENTIVFGNKYRSTYPDIDSDLTRAELCFRNGEYTQALTIAIATIDKIHPGSYEKLVRSNGAHAS